MFSYTTVIVIKIDKKHDLREAVTIGLDIAIEAQDLHVLWVLLRCAGADRH